MSIMKKQDWKEELSEEDTFEEEERAAFLKQIGNRITALRMKRDVSEAVLSRAIGKNNTYIQGITSGKAYPSMRSFLDICRYFDITPKEFFSENLPTEELLSPVWREMKELMKILPEEDIGLLVQIAKRMLK